MESRQDKGWAIVARLIKQNAVLAQVLFELRDPVEYKYVYYSPVE